jgi:Lrp/AsnC family transcriptional regulator, regulator for asnA, asnC and gidA
MGKVDELDLRIISLLQYDARRSFREIAEELDVAEGTVYNRVAKLREQAIIKNFIAELDFDLLGYDLTAVIGVISRGSKLAEVEKILAMEEAITAVYDVTGEYDAIIVAKVTDRDALNSLVKRINSNERVERTCTMVVLNTIKEQHGIKIK